MARPQKLKTEDILDRATDLFWKHGCDAVSTRDLEVALDLKAPAIYRRFESKNLFLARSIEYYVETVVDKRIRQVLDSAEHPIKGLRDFFREMLEQHSGEPELRGCLLTNTAAHQETKTPEVSAALNRGFEVIRSAFRRQIERAKDAGYINENEDAGALAQALFISLQGLLTLSRIGAPDLMAGIDKTFQLLGACSVETTRKGT
jgi:TetR/AcrR family transcriptional repressor of nem operon